MQSWLAQHADVECCDVMTIGLTRQAWCYEVPLLAIDHWDLDE